MIVCHCNVLRCCDVREAAEAVAGQDRLGVVTPGGVFLHHGKRPSCGCCMSSITQIIEDHHSEQENQDGSVVVRTVVQNRIQIEIRDSRPEAEGVDLTWTKD